jgi:DNA-binding NarL/FixJ family response regulator
MTAPPTFRVGIIDDPPRIREGLNAPIDGTDTYRSVENSGSIVEALAKLDHHSPDLLLVDIRLPGISGIEGARHIKERSPGLGVLMFSVYDDDRRIFDALCAGPCNYLRKNTPPARLPVSLRNRLAGGRQCRPKWRACCPGVSRVSCS